MDREESGRGGGVRGGRGGGEGRGGGGFRARGESAKRIRFRRSYAHVAAYRSRCTPRGRNGEGDMHTHGASGAAWCTVEREYKRLKAKRKQTGSSSSKPNSGGVKLRRAVGERGKLSSLCSPLYFHITFLNAPLNSKRRETRAQF